MFVLICSVDSVHSVTTAVTMHQSWYCVAVQNLIYRSRNVHLTTVINIVHHQNCATIVWVFKLMFEQFYVIVTVNYKLKKSFIDRQKLYYYHILMHSMFKIFLHFSNILTFSNISEKESIKIIKVIFSFISVFKQSWCIP